jgi:hypothetical protein
MDNLGTKLGYKTPEDWYEISMDRIIENDGWGALLCHNQSVNDLLKWYLPKHDWKEWKFNRVPKGFWDIKDNRIKYMDWLNDKLGYKTPKDWYKAKTSDFNKNYGGSILSMKYNGSLLTALKEYFPKHGWKEWMFSMTPMGFWQKWENRKKYLNWLGNKLKCKTYEDWYKVTLKDFEINYGETMMSWYYGNSRVKMLNDLMPENDWKEWLMPQVPKRHWLNSDNRKKYMDWLSEKLNFKTKDDWYKITCNDFSRTGADGLMRLYGYSPPKLVMDTYPEHKWDANEFFPLLKKQKRIFGIVKDLFPNLEVVFNYTSKNIKFNKSKHCAQLDIFIPSLKLAIEYQGQQHYMAVPFWGGEKSLAKLKNRDKEKRLLCEKNNIILIEIPYTWDGSKEYIENIINEKIR